MKTWLKSKVLWAVLAAALLLAVGYGARTSEGAKTSKLGAATKGELIQRVTIAGSVNPNRKTVISAPYNGYVRKLYVEIGQNVREGDPVVSIAQTSRGSDDDIYPMRAPFAGTVVQLLKTEGEYVDTQNTQGTGNAMVRIDDLSRIFIEASTPEIEIGKLKIGQEVVIKASAVLSRSYKGKIEHISLAAREQKDWDRSRVEFPVLIEVTDKDPQLKPGMSVIVDIITHKLTDVLTLRHEFIQKDAGKYFAVTERGDKRELQVGLQNEEVFEIKAGLVEGEKVRQTDFLSMLGKQ